MRMTWTGSLKVFNSIINHVYTASPFNRVVLFLQLLFSVPLSDLCTLDSVPNILVVAIVAEINDIDSTVTAVASFVQSL